MASDSIIICPCCGIKIKIPPFHPLPKKCHKCSHCFSGYKKCSLCSNFTKVNPCEICGYNSAAKRLTYKCKTCGEPIRKDSSACINCLDWKKRLRYIIDSIGQFSDLHYKGLIDREQFEVKIIDIVENNVSNNIPFKVMKNYLMSFKKMLDKNKIDKIIYNKISDLLLARCKVSENSQETLTKKREKAPDIVKVNSSTGNPFDSGNALSLKEVLPDTDIPPKIIGSSLSGSQKYYDHGLKLIKLFQQDEGIKHIVHAAKLGHSEAIAYLKDNKLEKIHEIRETESYLQSRKIVRPPVTQQQTKDNVSQTAETKKSGMGVGAKIIWSIVAVFVGSIVMGLIYEFQGFGILHGLAGIGTVCGLFFVWKR